MSFSWQMGNRLWYNCTMEHYWAIGRNTPLNKATVWMNLEMYCAKCKRPDIGLCGQCSTSGVLLADTKDRLYYTIVHKGYEHPQV